MMREEPAANDRAASQYWKDAKEKARSTKLLALLVFGGPARIRTENQRIMSPLLHR